MWSKDSHMMWGLPAMWSKDSHVMWGLLAMWSKDSQVTRVCWPCDPRTVMWCGDCRPCDLRTVMWCEDCWPCDLGTVWRDGVEPSASSRITTTLLQTLSTSVTQEKTHRTLISQASRYKKQKKKHGYWSDHMQITIYKHMLIISNSMINASSGVGM